jgi:magnesium transporter
MFVTHKAARRPGAPLFVCPSRRSEGRSSATSLLRAVSVSSRKVRLPEPPHAGTQFFRPKRSGHCRIERLRAGPAYRRHPAQEAGDWSKTARPRRLDRPVRTKPRTLQQVQTQFHLHPLAIEDAGNAHQQPKIEQYGDSLFIVARTAQMLEGRIAFGETHLFVGKGYVISVRHGASVSYARVRERCESCPTMLSHGEDYILYGFSTSSSTNMRRCSKPSTRRSKPSRIPFLNKVLQHSDVDRLYLLRARPSAAAQCRGATSRSLSAARAYRGGCHRPRDATAFPRRDRSCAPRERGNRHLARGAGIRVRGESDDRPDVQTGITRQLASWAAILAVPTAIAGIYGMNFKNMPELQWEYGYFVVIGAIITICVTLFTRFRKNNWL